jgi:hypothetical protein
MKSDVVRCEEFLESDSAGGGRLRTLKGAAGESKIEQQRPAELIRAASEAPPAPEYCYSAFQKGRVAARWRHVHRSSCAGVLRL